MILSFLGAVKPKTRST